jgi:hypothetical protein
MPQKTTVVLPEHLHARIKRVAAESGESMGEIIREWLEESAARHRPKPKSLGMGNSGRSDISSRIDELYEPDPWR